ncbi:MAG: M15 family metallopeptidase [Oscillospiraceae bacterium]|nr:M15 family metallopeptidase [Oscillospiraceae bacterium]
MMKRRIYALFLAMVLIISFCGCSEEENEHEEIISGGEIILEPVESSSSSSSEPEIPTGTEPAWVPESSSESSSEEIAESSSASSSEAEEPEEKTDCSVLILVNPWNYIPEDYDVNLVNVQGKYNLDEKAAESAKELVAAARKAGFDMVLCSAYRTVEKSAELYSRKVNQFINAGYDEATAKIEAAKWVAPPGTSEHHTGLAMDLVSSDYWGYYSDLEHAYENFDSFKWLYEHCAEFGFILRYPKDKQDITGITYEPWHYRYVGKEAAQYIMENGLCLEEYLELIK